MEWAAFYVYLYVAHFLQENCHIDEDFLTIQK